MPRVIELVDEQTASLAECVDAVAVSGFDPQDDESLHHAALWLRRLGNDQDFLGDVLIDELARRHRDDVLDNAYGPQVVMLSPPNGQFFIRAKGIIALTHPATRAGSSGDLAALPLPIDLTAFDLAPPK